MPSPTKPPGPEAPPSAAQFLTNNGYICSDRKLHCPEREGLLKQVSIFPSYQFLFYRILHFPQDECLKLEEIRIHENLLVNVPTTAPVRIVSPTTTRVCTTTPRRSSTRLEKYLACVVLGLLLGFSLVLLALFNQPRCTANGKIKINKKSWG